MKVPSAYLCVIIVSSTTPLGIVWSSESLSPTMAVLLRMCIAAVLGSILLVATRIRLPVSKPALRLYSYSGLGIFGGMICSYLAAGYIGSGLMSLLFGLSPIVAGLFAQRLLGEAKFTPLRWVALVFAICGLAIVCWDKLLLNEQALIGIGLILLAMVIFSFSGVAIKSVSINIHPLATTLGALYCCIPLFFITWLLFDGNINTSLWTNRSIGAIVYLGIFGSLLNYIAYFFILQRTSPTSVAMITFITPIFAILLGAQLNNESINTSTILGGGLVLIGLGLYHWKRKAAD